MSADRQRRSARALCALAALGAAAAITACGSGEDGTTTTSDAGGGEATGPTMKRTIPGQIDEMPHTFVSSDVLLPVNAWRTSSRHRLTEVDAGALAADRSTGAFAIFRHEFASGKQDVALVKVADSGPLRITNAPLGEGVEESAQENGEIEFAGARGVRGTLDLSDDTVSLREP
jgi:hypothetical protein